MATADNLLNMTQNFMTPDILQRFSGALDQPVEKIQSGLKAILPTFLMGLASKGSTPQGAQSIVNIVQSEGFDSTTPVTNLDNEHLLLKGTDTVNGIFGNNLNSVTSSLSSTTGMNTSSITKMMGLIAPVVLGLLGSKMKREGMSANGLSGFLSQQKSSLSSFLPMGVAGFFGGAASTVTAAANSAASSVRGVIKRPGLDALPQYGSKRRSWSLLGIIAVLFLGLIWYMSARETAQREVAPATISEPADNR